MTERLSKYFTFLFLFLLALPMLLHLLNRVIDIPIENTEKRNLAKLPTMPSSIYELIDWPKQFDIYVNDNLPIRNIINPYYHALLYLFNQSSTNKIVIGQEGWIYNNYDEVFDQIQGLKKIERATIQQNAKVLQQNYKYFAKKSIPFYFYIAPNKHSIYPEYLPRYVQVNPTKIQNGALLSSFIIKNNLLPIIDVSTNILKYKNTLDYNIYYKGDTHWKFVGSFAAYERVIGEIRQELTSLPFVEFSDLYEVDCEEYFGLFDRLGILPIVQEEGKDLKKLDSSIRLNAISGNATVVNGRKTSIYTNHKLTDGKKMLLIGDSFNGYIAPFFAHSFEEVLVTYHNFGDWDTSLLNDFKPDVVVYETLERFLIHDFQQTKFEQKKNY